MRKVKTESIMRLVTYLLLMSHSICIARNDIWEPTEFVWNLGIASHFVTEENMHPRKMFADGFVFPDFVSYRNNVIWLKPSCFKQFISEIKNKLDRPIVLVVCDGDESFPTDCLNSQEDLQHILNDDHIVHIFAQNCDYLGESSKISPLPIGLDFHTLAYKNLQYCWGERNSSPTRQETILKKILRKLPPTCQRKKRIYVDFHRADTIRTGCFHRYLEFGEDRTTIFHRILQSGLIDFVDNNLTRSELWIKKGQYAFSVSPHGNGLDCHRTWEDLILGSIVIVKTSPLDRLYEGLPVVIIKDWSEITEENLDKWLKQYGDAFTNPEYRHKLTTQYWVNKIKDAAR